jgi:tRNA(Ser,Leu) C12 N-acetylase TAN1
MENIDPDMLPPEWFEETEEGEGEGADDFDELEEKIKEAAENKKKYHKPT